MGAAGKGPFLGPQGALSGGPIGTAYRAFPGVWGFNPHSKISGAPFDTITIPPLTTPERNLTGKKSQPALPTPPIPTRKFPEQFGAQLQFHPHSLPERNCEIGCKKDSESQFKFPDFSRKFPRKFPEIIGKRILENTRREWVAKSRC